MASPTRPHRILLRTLPKPRLQCLHSTPSAPPAPPLLLKLRRDLKTSMQNKDTNRLNVLRSLLAEITNASKGPNPLKTDMQILSILRKNAAASRAASSEFQKAGRADLQEKEAKQLGVLEEYEGGVEMVSEEEVRRTVETVRETIQREGKKVDKGGLIRRCVGPDGALDGKNVDRGMVARVVDEVLGAGGQTR